MKSGEKLLLSVAVAVLLAGSVFDLYEFNTQGTTATTSSSRVARSASSSIGGATTWVVSGYATGTNVSSQVDIFFTSSACFQPNGGGGGFELRVAADSTNATVSGEVINAVDETQCIPQGGPPKRSWSTSTSSR